MFPFCGSASWGTEPVSRKSYQERKLKFLKWMWDDLETRLAGINAAIDTIECQLNRDETAI